MLDQIIMASYLHVGVFFIFPSYFPQTNCIGLYKKEKKMYGLQLKLFSFSWLGSWKNISAVFFFFCFFFHTFYQENCLVFWRCFSPLSLLDPWAFYNSPPCPGMPVPITVWSEVPGHIMTDRNSPGEIILLPRRLCSTYGYFCFFLQNVFLTGYQLSLSYQPRYKW